MYDILGTEKYELSIKESSVKDVNGDKVVISDLSVGDKVSFIDRKLEILDKEIYSAKTIKILDKDSTALSNKDKIIIYESDKGREKYVLSDLDYIQCKYLIYISTEYSQRLCEGKLSYIITFNDIRYGVEEYDEEIHIIRNLEMENEEEAIITGEDATKLINLLNSYKAQRYIKGKGIYMGSNSYSRICSLPHFEKYNCSLKDALIKDSNEQEINETDLKAGDQIEFIYKDEVRIEIYPIALGNSVTSVTLLGRDLNSIPKETKTVKYKSAVGFKEYVLSDFNYVELHNILSDLSIYKDRTNMEEVEYILKIMGRNIGILICEDKIYLIKDIGTTDEKEFIIEGNDYSQKNDYNKIRSILEKIK